MDLLANDGVGVLQDRNTLRRDLADDPHAEAGAGERLTPHDLVGQTELVAETADLVLEQRPQRLDQFQRHVLG